MIIKPDLKKLQQILGDYKIIEEIGSGGFKVVYSIKTKGKNEALKVVHIPSDPDDSDIFETKLM